VGLDERSVGDGHQNGSGRLFDSTDAQLPWKATEEERAIVCALRRATIVSLNDLTLVVCRISTATASGAFSRLRD